MQSSDNSTAICGAAASNAFWTASSSKRPTDRVVACRAQPSCEISNQPCCDTARQYAPKTAGVGKRTGPSPHGGTHLDNSVVAFFARLMWNAFGRTYGRRRRYLHDMWGKEQPQHATLRLVRRKTGPYRRL